MFKKETLDELKAKNRAEKKRGAQKLQQASSQCYDVVVVGAGISGASACHHLTTSTDGEKAKKFPTSLLLVEQGLVGQGRHDRTAIIHTDEEPQPPDPVVATAEEKFVHTGRSGGVLYSKPHFSFGPGVVKMVVRLYPCTTKYFIKHHGEEGARRYLTLAALGIEIQKEITKKLFPKRNQAREGDEVFEDVFEENGSVLLAEQDNLENLQEEFQLLRSLGCDDVVWMGKDEVENMHGSTAGFVGGIFFPNDTRINALAYVEALTRSFERARDTIVTVIEHCPPVCGYRDEKEGATTIFEGGVEVKSKHVVVASNGLFLDGKLAGMISPCWSYFVALPAPRDPLTTPLHLWESKGQAPISTPNFFTYGFSHDWCVTQGVFRISGEDHFSALKPPRAAERSLRMTDWSFEKYPTLATMYPTSFPPSTEERNARELLKGRYVYGVYANTPDSLPLVGRLQPNSRICYLVGCNAWGQASMSYVASLIPCLLGYEEWSKNQREIFELTTISRFSLRSFYQSSL